jgi:putative ABC transport system permease protein
MLGLIVVNVARRKARAALTAAGIAVGVAAIVALLALSAGLTQTAGQLVNLGRADFSVFQAGAADPTSSVLPLSLASRIRAEPGIGEVAPMQLLVGAVPNQPGAVLMGIEPNGFVAHYLVVESGTGVSPGRVDVGDLLARQLRVQVGSPLRLGGRSFVVAGIVHSGIPEQDGGVLTTLGDAQTLAGRTPDEVTDFAVRVNSMTTTAKATQQLKQKFPSLLIISSPEEAVRAGANGQLISKAVLLIVVLALIIGALAVANTMLAAVLERRRELALLMTLGWSARQLGGLVLGEAIAVSVLGTAAGLVLGIGASKLLPGALGLGAFISPVLTAWGFGRAVLIGIMIGLVGAAYPTWSVTRMRSVIALART